MAERDLAEIHYHDKAVERLVDEGKVEEAKVLIEDHKLKELHNIDQRLNFIYSLFGEIIDEYGITVSR